MGKSCINCKNLLVVQFLYSASLPQTLLLRASAFLFKLLGGDCLGVCKGAVQSGSGRAQRNLSSRFLAQGIAAPKALDKVAFVRSERFVVLTCAQNANGVCLGPGPNKSGFEHEAGR